jgi:hypothetical protein
MTSQQNKNPADCNKAFTDHTRGVSEDGGAHVLPPPSQASVSVPGSHNQDPAGPRSASPRGAGLRGITDQEEARGPSVPSTARRTDSDTGLSNNSVSYLGPQQTSTRRIVQQSGHSPVVSRTRASHRTESSQSNVAGASQRESGDPATVRNPYNNPNNNNNSNRSGSSSSSSRSRSSSSSGGSSSSSSSGSGNARSKRIAASALLSALPMPSDTPSSSRGQQPSEAAAAATTPPPPKSYSVFNFAAARGTAVAGVSRSSSSSSSILSSRMSTSWRAVPAPDSASASSSSSSSSAASLSPKKAYGKGKAKKNANAKGAKKPPPRGTLVNYMAEDLLLKPGRLLEIATDASLDAVIQQHVRGQKVKSTLLPGRRVREWMHAEFNRRGGHSRDTKNIGVHFYKLLEAMKSGKGDGGKLNADDLHAINLALDTNVQAQVRAPAAAKGGRVASSTHHAVRSLGFRFLNAPYIYRTAMRRRSPSEAGSAKDVLAQYVAYERKHKCVILPATRRLFEMVNALYKQRAQSRSDLSFATYTGHNYEKALIDSFQLGLERQRMRDYRHAQQRVNEQAAARLPAPRLRGAAADVSQSEAVNLIAGIFAGIAARNQAVPGVLADGVGAAEKDLEDGNINAAGPGVVAPGAIADGAELNVDVDFHDGNDHPPPPPPPGIVIDNGVEVAGIVNQVQIGVYNIDGIKHNLSMVLEEADVLKIDILLLTETKIGKLVNVPAGWNMHLQPRTTHANSGGGTAVLWRKDNLRLLRDKTGERAAGSDADIDVRAKANGVQEPTPNTEWMSFRLMHDNHRYDVITVLYNPPDRAQEKGLKKLMAYGKDQLTRPYCRGWVMAGDWNSCLWKNSQYTAPADVLTPGISATAGASVRGAVVWKLLRKFENRISLINVDCCGTDEQGRKTLQATHYTEVINHTSRTAIDMVVACGDAATRCSQLTVTDNMPSHQLVTFKLAIPTLPAEKFVSKPNYRRLRNSGDKAKTLELKQAFTDELEKRAKKRNDQAKAEAEASGIAAAAHTLTDVMVMFDASCRAVCGSTKPRVQRYQRSKPWWNALLTSLSNVVKKAKRRLQVIRKRNRANGDQEQAAVSLVKSTRTAYTHAQVVAKRAFYYDLRTKLNAKDGYDVRGASKLIRLFTGSRGTGESPHSFKTMTDAWRPIMENPPPTTSRTKAATRELFGQNGVDDDGNGIEEGEDGLLAQWRAMGDGIVSDEEAATAAEVIAAVKRAKSNKAPGFDGITNEALQCLIGGPLSAELIAQAFTHCLRHPDQMPGNFHRSLICLIPKNADPGPTDYRPITLLSCLAKLLEMLIQHRVNMREKTVQEDAGHQYTSDNQTGFKNKRGTFELVLRLLTANNRCRVKKKPLWMAFFDVKKAFDSVPHVLIMHALSQRNLPAYLLQWMWHWIRNHRVRLLAGDGKTNLNDLSMDLLKARGTAQGSVTAPGLFNMYYNFIMEQLPRDADNLHYSDPPKYPPLIGSTQMDGCYADDNVQARTRLKRLRGDAKKMEAIATEHAVDLHPKKSEVMIGGFSSKVSQKRKVNHGIKLYNEQLPLSDEFNYVGVLLNHCSLYRNELDNREAIGKVLKMTEGRGVRAWSSAYGMPTCLGSMLVKSMAYGSCFYGTQVLQVNGAKTDTALARLAKSVLNTYKCAGHDKVLRYLGWMQSKTYGALLNVGFALKMCQHEVTTIRTSFMRYITLRRNSGTPFVKLLNNNLAVLGDEAVTGYNNWILELNNLPAGDRYADGTTWPWLTTRKNELKEEFKPHPIVQHSVHGHHSFTFMRDTKNFNPKAKYHPCWLCNGGGQSGDGPEHIVQHCSDERVVLIMKSFCKDFGLANRGLAVAILIDFMNYKDEEHACAAFTADKWRAVSRYHFRLYRLRKAERDKMEKPGYRVEIDNLVDNAQLAADAAARPAAADAEPQADEVDEDEVVDDNLDMAGNQL